MPVVKIGMVCEAIVSETGRVTAPQRHFGGYFRKLHISSISD